MQIKEELEKIKRSLRDLIELSKNTAKGPYEAKAYRARETSSETPEVWLRAEDRDIACLVNPDKDLDLVFVAAASSMAPGVAQILLDGIEALERCMQFATLIPGTGMEAELFRELNGDIKSPADLEEACKGALQEMICKYKGFCP